MDRSQRSVQSLDGVARCGPLIQRAFNLAAATLRAGAGLAIRREVVDGAAAPRAGRLAGRGRCGWWDSGDGERGGCDGSGGGADAVVSVVSAVSKVSKEGAAEGTGLLSYPLTDPCQR